MGFTQHKIIQDEHYGTRTQKCWTGCYHESESVVFSLVHFDMIVTDERRIVCCSSFF